MRLHLLSRRFRSPHLRGVQFLALRLRPAGRGADVNACADVDSYGLGGQTPIFHAVNSIFNYCRPAMALLVDRGARLDIQVKSLLWGESFAWETVIFDVTPISYAQCGLYKQFHRAEGDVYSNIAYLHERYGAAPALRNVPNQYLRG